MSRFLPAILSIILACIHREALAVKHSVGGSQGWDQSTDFDSWTSAQTFTVGDELEFKYFPGLHSVVELASESEYKSCDVGKATKSLNGGSDSIKLDKPGVRYFACGTSGHCEQGMKVKITTVAASGSSSSSSSSNTTPPSTPTTTHPPSSASDRCHFLGLFGFIASTLIYLMISI